MVINNIYICNIKEMLVTLTFSLWPLIPIEVILSSTINFNQVRWICYSLYQWLRFLSVYKVEVGTTETWNHTASCGDRDMKFFTHCCCGFHSQCYNYDITSISINFGSKIEVPRELNRSVDMTSSGKNGLNIRINARPKLENSSFWIPPLYSLLSEALYSVTVGDSIETVPSKIE